MTKKEIKIEVPGETEETVETVKQVEPLAINFQSEDLNKLRDKVNELVDRQNAIQE